MALPAPSRNFGRSVLEDHSFSVWRDISGKKLENQREVVHHNSYSILVQHFRKYTALIYLNAFDQLIGNAPHVEMMIQGRAIGNLTENLTQIGFVVQKKEGKRKNLFFTEAQKWPAENNRCLEVSCGSGTTIKWLPELNSDSVPSVLLDLDSGFFFGFYILFDGKASLEREQLLDTFQFEIQTFKVEVDYVNRQLESDMDRIGYYSRSRFVPGLTRIRHKTKKNLPEKLFQGLTIEGNIEISSEGVKTTVISSNGREEAWEVDKETYPPMPFYSLESRSAYGERIGNSPLLNTCIHV